MSNLNKNKISAKELATHFVSFGQNSVPLVPAGAVVEAASLQPLKSNELPTYRQVKATFKQDLTSRDTRFRLSEQVASQLSVEQEEEERFQKRVEAEVDARLSIIKTEAQTKGFAQGQEEGRAQAYNEEKARLAKVMESVAMLLKNLEEAKDHLAQDYEGQLLEFAIRIAEVIMHKEIADRPESISATVKAILNKISKEDDVRIRLPTSVYATFEEVKKQIAEGNRVGRIHVEVDTTLKEGSCVVESLSGEITSVLEESIEKMRTELLSRHQQKKRESA